tara:strand:+ start:799 stop:1041 length:243 start_codon:yes stop_codon:yes gene_type:complete
MNKTELENSLKKIFINILKIKSSELVKANQDNTKNWDSVKHMNLILEIENVYNITLNASDVVKMNSYNETIKIIKKYLRK